MSIVADMKLIDDGFEPVLKWVNARRPGIKFTETEDAYGDPLISSMLPYDLTDARCDDGLTDNEVLIELAGRGCYQSFGSAAGQKTNREYIHNTQKGKHPHKSILYHAKFTLFVAGISRRLSHEIIRHYVGADRTEELSPSQESTRYTEHTGTFICPPARLVSNELIAGFTGSVQRSYNDYIDYIEDRVTEYQDKHSKAPTGLDRKRIYEDASSLLPHSAETSMFITMNPESAAKMIRERSDYSADLEFIRLVSVINKTLGMRYKNLFPVDVGGE